MILRDSNIPDELRQSNPSQLFTRSLVTPDES